jgi:hypothetical protein
MGLVYVFGPGGAGVFRSSTATSTLVWWFPSQAPRPSADEGTSNASNTVATNKRSMIRLLCVDYETTSTVTVEVV